MVGFEKGDCGCVYKNHEQRAEGAASLAWTEQTVNEPVKAYLRSLDDQFLLDTPPGELLAVHGSPRRINEYLFEDRSESALERMAREYPYRAIMLGADAASAHEAVNRRSVRCCGKLRRSPHFLQ